VGGRLDGTIDAIVSDHSPATLALKTAGGGDFGLAWGGIAGVQTGFASVWTEAARRGIPLESLLPLFTTGPARIAGMPGLGVIAPGVRANLTVFAPERSWTVDAHRLLYRHKLSPWDGAPCAAASSPPWSAAPSCTAGDDDVRGPAGNRTAGRRGADAATPTRCAKERHHDRDHRDPAARIGPIPPASTTSRHPPRRCSGGGCRAPSTRRC
jgi:allantoinase